MKLFLPKQHGAWAMLIVPFWLGVIGSHFMWEHIPFFIGWVFLYLATYPMLLLFKRKKIQFYIKWTLIYIIPAILLLLVPFFTRPSIIVFGLAMIPLFAINAYFSSKNKDRALTNDISAIIAFAIAGLASAYLADGTVTMDSFLLFSTSILFFLGSTFYVKTMIREKKNLQYKWISWSYHLLVPTLWIFLGLWIAAFAYIPSLLRAIGFYGKSISAKQVGIYEIVNAALFFILMALQVFKF